MSENNTNNGPPPHRRPTASSSTSPAHSVNSNTHHPPPGGGGGAAYNPHSMQGGQGRGRGSHLPIGPAGAAIGGGAVGVGGGGQADDIAALIAVASGTPGATLNPRLLSAQIAMRNQAMVRAQVAHQAHAARHNNNRLTSPQPTFGGGVEHNNNPSSSRGGPTVSSSMPMHPPPPYPPSPHAPPPHGGMPAPPAAAAASWALGSSAKALRTLALMKSLGVSPSATALAAAVLPTNANALPKTAAALNAAAAAGYLHRSGGGGGGAPTRAGAGEGGGASATVAQGASGSDGATPIANTAKTNAGMASATAGAGAGAGAGGFAYPRPQSATNMRMPYQHPYLNQVSMANNNNTNNKDGGDINNDESNSVTGGAPASASAQPRLATASSAGSGGPPHLPLRPNNMSHLDFYAQLQAKYNHLPTNIPTAANLNLNHQLQQQLQQNHPQGSRSAGGSPSRQSMQQAYGEENPVFYERLVQILGKEMADEMVKEAVDETIKEEVEGEGSSEGGTTREEAGGTGTAEEKIEGKMKGTNEEEKPYSTTSVAAAVEKKGQRNEEVIAIDSSDDDDEGKPAARMKAAETTTAALEHRIAQKQKELSSATGVLPHQNAVSPNKKPGATALAASPSSQHTKESLLLSSSPQFGSRGITGVPNPLPTPAQLAAMRRNVLKKRQQPHLGVRYHAPVVHEDIDKNKRKAGAAAVDNNAAPPSPQKSTMAKNTTTAGAAAAAAAAASETRATTMVDLTDNIMKRRKLHQGPPGPAVNASSSMNSNLLHSLFGRSSQDYYQGAPGVVAATAAAPSTQAASTQSASAAARGGNNNNNSGTITGQQITAEQGGVVYGRDPPGFEQFRADPEFCRLIVEAAEKHKKDCANGSSNKKDVKSVGAVFVHGLLNIDDGQIRESLALDADRSVRDYVRDVISPYFNVPLNLVDSEGNWEAYVHISSDNINEFARNVVYRRRKSMKSAVELAFYELRKHERKSQKEENEADSDSKKTSTNNINEKTSQSNAVHEEELRAKDKRIKEHEEELRAKDKRIKELEKELAMLNGNHDKQVAAIKDEHAKETKDKQKKYGDFVANLVKTNRKEVSDLKKQMKTMQSVHTTFLESYVEASVDALRYESDSPSL